MEFSLKRRHWRLLQERLKFSSLRALETLRYELMSFFHEFHYFGLFWRSLHAFSLVLIPIKGRLVDIKDLWPINLVDKVYNLLVGVLTNRLKKVIIY